MHHISLLHVTADLLLQFQGLAGDKTYCKGKLDCRLQIGRNSSMKRFISRNASMANTGKLHRIRSPFSLVKKNTAIWRLCSCSNDTWLAHASLAAIACFETDFACLSSSRADCSAICKSAWLMRSACKSEHWQSKNKESPQGQQWFNCTIHMHHLGAASFAMRSSRYFLDARALGISATHSVQIPN